MALVVLWSHTPDQDKKRRRVASTRQGQHCWLVYKTLNLQICPTHQCPIADFMYISNDYAYFTNYYLISGYKLNTYINNS